MNCRAKIAGSKLMNATDSEAETYMNLLWTMMVKENGYREWLSHKCSVKYQAVQDKFASESTRWMMIVACLLQYFLLCPPSLFVNYAEMYSECKIDGLILPWIESFQMRLKHPKVNFIFYEYFFKAVVGDGTLK
jgi:hypothetical protein